ncbi:MAG: hypothetical protein NTW19_20690, partial [Planctomycetota bacterium]|nr:hypothetical protein [Planctomycetota bacterium]
ARATTAAASASSDDTAEIDLSLEPSENDAATAEDPSNETTEMISPTAAADRAVVEPPAEKSPAPVAHAAPAPATPAPPAAAPFDRSAPSTAPARPASAEPVAAAASPAPPVPALDIVFPAGLQVTGHPPHLAVVSCNQEGVLFAFDAGFLEHMGFRRSMPQRCAMSGQAQKADLIARPLAFVDRAKTPVRSPREVEIHHEVQLDAHRSPADVLHAMGQLEQLPAPFNRPLPYYVATGHSLASLSCSTINRADGGVTCRVLIPDGQTALEWLMRVNGVCGPEHPLLEHAVGMLWSDAWRELPDKVRHRLSAWCGFEPMESFRVYLPDADFAKQDLGLAGVVITDRRLIHCKFNHKGQAPLDAEAVLRVQPEGEFVNLTLQTVVERVKVAKLSLADLPALVRGLRDAKGLTLQMGGRE